jgi:hypothetical protein
MYSGPPVSCWVRLYGIRIEEVASLPLGVTVTLEICGAIKSLDVTP